MGQAGSVLFYAALTLITCVMAWHVKSAAGAETTDGDLRQRGINKLYLGGIFAVLFAVSALRYGIGNDYEQYTVTAHEAYVGGYVVTEAGFNLLVKAVYTLFGRECYEAIFAIFAFVTLFVFLHTLYRDSADFAQSFFLFMTLGIYFQTFNTVRYYFALSAALCCMRYVLEKDYIRFVFFILIAALFLKSVLLVIPAYLLASIEWKRWMLVSGAVLSALCFAGRGVILKLALALYPSYKNTIYLEGGMSVTSVVRIAAVLALYLWTAHYIVGRWKDYREIRFYGQLNFLALLAATFFSFLPVVTRIVYYFSISQLFLLPLLLKQIEDERVRKRVKLIAGLVCIAYFVLFLREAAQAGVGLLPYRTWLFNEEG